MSFMRLSILWLQWVLLRRPSVILFDTDGSMNARLAHGIRNHRYAKRYGFGIRTCVLAAGGAFVNDCCYVEKWAPLFPRTFEI